MQGVDPEREDYAEPPSTPTEKRELAWAVALFLALPLIGVLLAFCCAFSFFN